MAVGEDSDIKKEKEQFAYLPDTYIFMSCLISDKDFRIIYKYCSVW